MDSRKRNFRIGFASRCVDVLGGGVFKEDRLRLSAMHFPTPSSKHFTP